MCVCRDAAGDVQSLCAARLVCRQWRAALSSVLRIELTPGSLLSANHGADFRAAASLDLTDAAPAGALSGAALAALLPRLTALTSPTLRDW